MRSFCLALTLLAVATATPARAACDDSSELRATIEITRNVGTAMFAWLTDQPATGGGQDEASGDTMSWASCPPIAHAEAEALLVPRYLAELPATDGWGHPLQLCLRRDGTAGSPVMGIRSPGRDGSFEGDTYTAGAYDVSDVDRDVVWMDGYFVRWPQRQEQ